MHFIGSPSYIVASELRALKEILKIWNKEVFGDVKQRMRDDLTKVAAWDSLEEMASLTSDEMFCRVEAREE